MQNSVLIIVRYTWTERDKKRGRERERETRLVRDKTRDCIENNMS